MTLPDKASPGEAGAVAVTALVAWLAAALAGVALITTAADLAMAALRAQAAADAAALAAAGATMLGPYPGEPRAAAQAAARLHGAELVSCCGDTGIVPPALRVAVAVTPGSAPARAVRPRLVRAAWASLRPAKEPPNASGFAARLPNR